MKGTLISWNIPNMITVPLMTFVAFLVVIVVWQLVRGFGGGQTANNSGGGGY